MVHIFPEFWTKLELLIGTKEILTSLFKVEEFSLDTREEVESYWKEQLRAYSAKQTLNKEVILVGRECINGSA